MNRQTVYSHIDSEREYQNHTSLIWNHKGQPDLAAEILLMEEYLLEMRNNWRKNSDNSLALDCLRKLLGIGVRCYENYGANANPRVFQKSIEERAPITVELKEIEPVKVEEHVEDAEETKPPVPRFFYQINVANLDYIRAALLRTKFGSEYCTFGSSKNSIIVFSTEEQVEKLIGTLPWVTDYHRYVNDQVVSSI